MARKPKTVKPEPLKETETSVETNTISGDSSKNSDKLEHILSIYPKGSPFDLAAFEAIREIWGGRVGAISKGSSPKYTVEDSSHLVVVYSVHPDTFDQTIDSFLTA